MSPGLDARSIKIYKNNLNVENGLDETDDHGAMAGPLEVLQKRLLAGLGDSPFLIALYDGDDKLRYANRACREAFLRGLEGDLDYETIIRSNYALGTGVRIQDPSIDEYVVRVRQRRRSQPHRAFPIELVDGRRLWLTETLLEDGWLLCEANDITSMKQAEKSLRISRAKALEASQTDFLTKLPNRRQAYTFLERVLAFTRSGDIRLSVALVDLDYFKLVNDRYGHDIGDLALCRFADALRTNLRASDLVARIGGEEFLVIWSNASCKSAFDSLMRLRARQIEVDPPSAASRFMVTFSAGVTEAMSVDTTQSLVGRADRALYAAKAKGRNCIEMDED